MLAQLLSTVRTARDLAPVFHALGYTPDVRSLDDDELLIAPRTSGQPGAPRSRLVLRSGGIRAQHFEPLPPRDQRTRRERGAPGWPLVRGAPWSRWWAAASWSSRPRAWESADQPGSSRFPWRARILTPCDCSSGCLQPTRRIPSGTPFGWPSCSVRRALGRDSIARFGTTWKACRRRWAGGEHRETGGPPRCSR